MRKNKNDTDSLQISLFNVEKKDVPSSEGSNPIYFDSKSIMLYDTYAPKHSIQRKFMDLFIDNEDWHATRCGLVWKMKTSKSFRPYCILGVTDRKIYDDDATFLPTPCAKDGERGLNANTTKKVNGRFIRTSIKTGTKFGASLGMAAATGLLPTPTTRSYKGDRVLTNGQNMTHKGQKFSLTLEQKARLISNMPNATSKSSQLSPRFVMEIMGFPSDWTLIPFSKTN